MTDFTVASKVLNLRILNMSLLGLKGKTQGVCVFLESGWHFQPSPGDKIGIVGGNGKGKQRTQSRSSPVVGTSIDLQSMLLSSITRVFHPSTL